MQNKFTDQARRVLEQAAFAAEVNGHCYIGSEHLLLGLIQVEDCLAGKVLLNNDVTENKVLNLIYQLIAPDNEVSVKEPAGYTPRVSKILTNSIEEAARFKADKVGTEHILNAIMTTRTSLFPNAEPSNVQIDIIIYNYNVLRCDFVIIGNLYNTFSAQIHIRHRF